MKSRRIKIQLKNRKDYQIIEAHKLKGGCGCFIYCIDQTESNKLKKKKNIFLIKEQDKDFGGGGT